MSNIDWVNHTKFRNMLILHEGERAHLYNDLTGKVYKSTLGKLTIGIGRNIETVGLYPHEIQYLLTTDITRNVAALDNRYPWWHNMEEARQAVLLDMCFNMGIGKLSTFVNTLNFMQSKLYHNAALNMKASLWYKQVGTRSRRLVKMMETGEWYSE